MTRPEILVVDDDDLVRGMVAYLFDDAGFTVREAADGDEALAALEERAPDCMVLDLMMPKVDGYAVLKARREKNIAPDTRVVILTAKTDTHDAVSCWELGADEFITKPFDSDKLLREVKVLTALTAEEARERREFGLNEAKRLDQLDKAFKKRRR